MELDEFMSQGLVFSKLLGLWVVLEVLSCRIEDLPIDIGLGHTENGTSGPV